MDINLPLILVLLSFAGIAIWLVDFFTARPKRRLAIEGFKQQWPQWSEKSSEDAVNFHKAVEEVQGGKHWLVRETHSLLPILLLVLILRSFIAEPFQIPSSSMEPTLEVGDFILVNKFTYGIRLPVLRSKVIEMNAPKRGDVMVFFPPHDKRYFIKRVVGVPGDVIEYRDKQLYVNGQLQALEKEGAVDLLSRQAYIENLDGLEHKIYQNTNRGSKNIRALVKEGHYFMMGDNRDNSHDSRYWGTVPESNIVGKAFAIWMHWKDWSSLPSFSRVGSFQ